VTEPVPVDPFPGDPATRPSWFAWAAKFVTAVLGIAGLAISQGLIEGTAAKWAAIIISVATAGGVFAVPNAKRAAAHGSGLGGP
jgi:hypothetical protein